MVTNLFAFTDTLQLLTNTTQPFCWGTWRFSSSKPWCHRLTR